MINFCWVCDICGLSPGIKGQTLLSTAFWYQSMQGKHNEITTVYNNTLLKDSKINFWSGYQSHVAIASLLADNTDDWPTHTLLVLQQKDSVPAHRGQAVQRGWPGPMWYTQLNRTKECTLSLKQGKTFPHKVINQHSLPGSLSLVRKCSRSKSILLQPRGGEKNVHRRLSFL